MHNPLSILLANVLVPGNFEVAWQRTFDVAVGAAIGIVVSILVLPQPVKDTLPARLTAAIDAVGEFLDTVIAAFRDPVTDTHPARAKAERALLDLNILVGQPANEPSTWRQGAGPSADATRVLRAVVDDAATMLAGDGPPPTGRLEAADRGFVRGSPRATAAGVGRLIRGHGRRR